MTARTFSKRRLIENEEKIRGKNTAAKEALDKYLAHDATSRNELVSFYCECSHDDCKTLLKISINDYERAHRRNDRFIVAENHDIPGIEKIVASNPQYVVVQKHDLPA